jgi:transposase
MSKRVQAPATALSSVYAAIELSKKNWVLAIARPDRDQPSIHRVADGCLEDLVRKLRAATRDGDRLVVRYEAGHDGFWLARASHPLLFCVV